MSVMEIARLKHSKTKRLARELGLLPSTKRLRKTAVGGNEASPRKRRKGQLLTYLIVIDFESTCWKGKKGMQEIIEFPAVLLDMCNGRIASEFHHYIGPTECPVLSAFCKELTGISQTQVDNGIPLPTCLYLFKQWICKLREEMGVVLMEPGHTYSDKDMLCALVTWSDWDLEVCLSHECSRKQIRKPVFFSQWINIRAVYKSFYERKPCGLNGALEDLGIKFIGRQHSGIDDAKNTAILCYRMIRDGCRLTITKCIHNQLISQIKPPPPSPSLNTPPSILTRKPLSGTSSNIEHATPGASKVEGLADENSATFEHSSPKAPKVRKLDKNSECPSSKARKIAEYPSPEAPKMMELAKNSAKHGPEAPRVKELVESSAKCEHVISKPKELAENSAKLSLEASKEAAKSGHSVLVRPHVGLMESVDDWGDAGGELFCEVAEEMDKWERELNGPLKASNLKGDLHLCGASGVDSVQLNVRSTLEPAISLKSNLPHPFHRCGPSHRTSESSTSAPEASESPVSIHASSHPCTASGEDSVWPSSKALVKSQLVTHLAPVTLLSPASGKSCAVAGSSGGLPGPLKGFYGASKESLRDKASSSSASPGVGVLACEGRRGLCRGAGGSSPARFNADSASPGVLACEGRRGLCRGAGGSPPARFNADSASPGVLACEGRRGLCRGAGGSPPARFNADSASPGVLACEGRGYRRDLCRGAGAARELLNVDEQVTPCSTDGGGGGGGGSLADHQSPNVIEETPPAEQGTTGRDSSLSAMKGSVSTTSPSTLGFKTPNTTSWLKSKQAFSPKTWSSVSPLSSSFLFASGGKITPPLCGCGRSGGKITPPLCGCGRRAKRKVVCSPGPNEGKPFYVCPRSRGNDRKQGCNYFKWEDRTGDSPSNTTPLLSDYGECRYS